MSIETEFFDLPQDETLLNAERCDALLNQVCTSGRPFLLVHVRVVVEESASGSDASDGGSAKGRSVVMKDVTPGSGEVGELWVRGPTVFSGRHTERASPHAINMRLSIYLSL